jgi:uncharacterized protein YrrD
MRTSCLFKGHDLLNKPITARDTGAILGYAQDIIFDQDQNQVLAFLVDPRWRIESRVLPWSGIYSVTVDGIVSHNAAMLTEGMNLLAIQRIFDRHNLRRGMRLALPDGRSLGRMDDIYFDAHGVIEGYATVTSQPGRAGYFVPAPKFLEVYADRAVVAEDTWRRMQENATARRRLPNALRLVAEDLWQRKGEQLRGSDVDVALLPLADELAHIALHLVEGCCVRTTVLSGDGLIVAVAGAIVTQRGIERARACERERALLSAVGADPVGALLAVIENGDAAPT